MLGLPEGQRFGAIYADPPWRWNARSPKGETRSAQRYYSTMRSETIAALPIADLAAKDCVLFLWAIDAMLPQAMEVMNGWGFTYKTVAFTWVKTGRQPDRTGIFPIGTGFWTRANPEMCLLGTRGEPKRLSRAVPQLVIAPRGEHSRKPPEVRERIVELVRGPYVELFARERSPGWVSWGDQL
jgi:N6-adenosine-specific RNA methylase IME4